MKSLTLHAPAKINLYLDVISKRRDGYHNIETIFQKIGLCDKIKVSVKNKGISIDCGYPGVPNSKANSAYKAALLLKEEFRFNRGVAIEIIKKIPPAAGLGGGSSDAASVIMAINRLFGLNIAPKGLIPIAKRIGADVPFFVSGYNCALARGIGEELKEVRHSRRLYVMLLKPGLRIYTKTIYSKVSLALTKQAGGANILARNLSDCKKRNGIASLLYNRLEDVVLPTHPVVREAKELLSLYKTEGVLLSGSGPVVFALFNRRKEAMRARREICRYGKWQVFLTNTI